MAKDFFYSEIAKNALELLKKDSGQVDAELFSRAKHLIGICLRDCKNEGDDRCAAHREAEAAMTTQR